MSEIQQMIYMQTRMIRIASEKWEMPIHRVAELFAQYKVLQLLRRCLRTR